MNVEPAPRVGYRQALQSSQFRALWAAQLVSVSGTSIAAVALTVLIYRRTSSPLLASLTFSLSFLPYLIGGGILSSLVDRVRHRRLVVLCDGLSALVAAGMAWPDLPVPVLLGLLFIIGTMSSLASGARAALVRLTVSDDAYVPGRSLMRIASQVAQIGGNAGAGALLVVVSPRGALLINSASFALSSATIRLAVGNHANLGNRDGTVTRLGSLRGARIVLAHREVRRLLLLGWWVPMFAVAPEALAAPYVAGQHASSSLVGWWLTALPIGLIIGDIAAVRLLSPRQQRLLVAPAALAGFVPFLAFVASPPIQVALPLLVLSGGCAFYSLGVDARLRDATPTPLFTRTMSLNSAGLMAFQGIGFTLAGAIAQVTSPATAIVIAGICGIATTVLLLRSDPHSKPWTQVGPNSCPPSSR